MLRKQLRISEDENGLRTVSYLEYDDLGSLVVVEEKPLIEDAEDRVALKDHYDTINPRQRLKPTLEALEVDNSSVKLDFLPDDFPGHVALVASNITTYEDLSKLTDLTSVIGIGGATAAKIKDALADYYSRA